MCTYIQIQDVRSILTISVFAPIGYTNLPPAPVLPCLLSSLCDDILCKRSSFLRSAAVLVVAGGVEVVIFWAKFSLLRCRCRWFWCCCCCCFLLFYPHNDRAKATSLFAKKKLFFYKLPSTGLRVFPGFWISWIWLDLTGKNTGKSRLLGCAWRRTFKKRCVHM